MHLYCIERSFAVILIWDTSLCEIILDFDLATGFQPHSSSWVSLDYRLLRVKLQAGLIGIDLVLSGISKITTSRNSPHSFFYTGGGLHYPLQGYMYVMTEARASCTCRYRQKEFIPPKA